MNEPVITMKQLYPQLPDGELKIVEENLEQYLAVVIRIYQRISLDPEALAELRADLQAQQHEVPAQILTE